MAHITLPEGLPGIIGLLAFRPETAEPMRMLSEFLLRAPNSLTRAERETIAAYTSSENDCYFCQMGHGAAAAHHLGGNLEQNLELIDQVKRDYRTAPISNKLKALLAIASQVQKGGKHVTADDIERARQTGATDLEIHDTVLIAAAFCMYNRYVDGLATWVPKDPELYLAMGERLAEQGYVNSAAGAPVEATV
jgi:uncharacterized peroxidase-related enzyme